MVLIRTINPVSSSSTATPAPETAVQIEGFLIAFASTGICGNPAWCIGQTTTSIKEIGKEEMYCLTGYMSEGKDIYRPTCV